MIYNVEKFNFLLVNIFIKIMIQNLMNFYEIHPLIVLILHTCWENVSHLFSFLEMLVSCMSNEKLRK